MSARRDDPFELGQADEPPLPQHATIMLDGRRSHAARGVGIRNVMPEDGGLPVTLIHMLMPNGLGIHYEVNPTDARRLGEGLVRLAAKAELRAAEDVAVRLVNLKQKGTG